MLSNSIRSKKWVVNCRRQDLDKKDPKYLYNNCKICSEHFEDSMFSGHLKNRLKDNAVPTLFSVPNPPKSIGAKRRLLYRDNTQIQGKRINIFFYQTFMPYFLYNLTYFDP